MAKEKTDYDRLQECSQKVSEIIELEKLYRAQVVDISGVELPFPPELVQKLKQSFQTIRVEIIVTLNAIHL